MSRLVAVEAVPMTLQPSAGDQLSSKREEGSENEEVVDGTGRRRGMNVPLAIWQAAIPTPPAAACTSTQSPVGRQLLASSGGRPKLWDVPALAWPRSTIPA